MSKRKNVTVYRKENGDYILCGKSGDYTLTIAADDWRALGLRSLRKGFEGVLDLQASGVPKKRKVRK